MRTDTTSTFKKTSIASTKIFFIFSSLTSFRSSTLPASTAISNADSTKDPTVQRKSTEITIHTTVTELNSTWRTQNHRVENITELIREC